MTFRLTVKAEDDIVNIAEQGVRLFGLAQARRYHDDLFALFQLIADSPHMARERQELSPPVRIHPFRSHLVIYQIQPDGDVVILRLRHGREDWLSELS
ncbi:type II toxin-antitoxin system RelE/ParE family toxin [Escherichia coli]|nr:type II toxin-antitoxin system RelE/ParE family toxin [Salmonella enterica subsp. enterica]EBW1604020.1 type II toxin-antitoxin system RelE/ParE family toxin [Salmonella enterica subsp. enterica serovar Kottbus]EBW2250168.1 type II toxin-antitoxin system RelE/ParE family toxin [Salmonella enterica subsp. enterica serovar Enteritidis]EBX4817027.1 type II toxin-antitoxin system RelE/ParE family toxin [Salmonella enterica subsp. enterica serovar Newport]ECI7685690.1 type II toxin-antitoxin syst